METRKLQVSGHSTYILSLPKSWVKNNSIKKGDRVRLRLQQDGTILLTPSKIEGQRSRITVSVRESGASLFRKFLGLYLAGYQVIRFEFKNGIMPEDRKELRKIIQLISGLEILDEGETSITVHDLFDSSLFSSEKALRRMFLLSKTMLGDSVTSFIHGDSSLAMEVMTRDEDVDLLNWLINRQYNLILQDLSLSERLKISPQRGLCYLLLAKSLERIGDHATKIVRREVENADQEKLLHGDLKLLSDRLVENMEMAVGSFFKKDFDSANFVIDRTSELKKEIKKLIEEGVMKGDDPVQTSMADAFILDSLRCVCAYTIDIAETSINNLNIEE